MIGVVSQYLIKFKLDNNVDFISEEELLNFELLEEAGNVLPSFKLEFKLRDENIIKYLNESNVLEIALGESELSVFNIRMRILHSTIKRESKNQYMITLTGLQERLDYLSQDYVAVSDKKSGVETIIDTVQSYFKVDTNILRSEDSQYWIQNNIPDKLFINNVWMHSYIKDSFLALGISVDGKFILRDMKKTIRNGSKWRLTNSNSSDSKDIKFEGDYIIDSESGFINQWMGYDRYKNVLDIEEGELSKIESSLRPMLAMSKNMNRTKNIDKRALEFGLLNDNVHEKYWDAYIQNITYLAKYSSNKIFISYSNLYKPMKVLDIIMLKDDELSTSQSSEGHSGLYIITKIKRTIREKVFYTTLELNREVMNNVKGNN